MKIILNSTFGVNKCGFIGTQSCSLMSEFPVALSGYSGGQVVATETAYADEPNRFTLCPLQKCF